MTPDETLVVLERSRGLRLAFPSSFGNPGLEGDAPEREEVAEAVRVLEPQAADELAGNAWRLWMVSPRDVEGGRTVVAGRESSSALYGAGLFALQAGNVAESRRLNERALTVADTPVDKALAHIGLGRAASYEGDAEQALGHALEAREAAAALGEAMGQAPMQGELELRRVVLHLHAQAVRLRGDFDEAAELFEQSLALNRRIGDEGMVDVEQYNLGFVNLRRGEVETAVRYLAEMGDDPLAAAALAFARGELETARALLDQVDPDLPPDDRAEAEWLRTQL